MKLNITLLMLVFVAITNTFSAQTVVGVDVKVGDDSNASNKKQIGDRLYYLYEDPIENTDLIGYLDENAEPHNLIYDLPSGVEFSGQERKFVDLNGTAYWIQYFYDNATGEYPAYVCTEVNDTVVFLTPSDLNPYNLSAFNNELYFGAFSAATGYELYKMNGTNVSLVADLNPGTSNSEVYNLTPLNNKLYFSYRNAGFNGYMFGEYDGTTIVSDTLTYNTSYSEFSAIKASNDTIYILDNDQADTLYQWVNGEINGFTGFDYGYYMEVINGDVYIAPGYTTNWRLYKLNTATSTVDTLSPANSLNYINDMVQFQGKIFLAGRFNSSTYLDVLAMVDPLTDTIVEVVIPNLNSYVGYLQVLNNELYMSAGTYDPTSGFDTGTELFHYNNGSPQLYADFDPGNYNSSEPYDFVLFNGSIAVTADQPGIGTEIGILCFAPNAPSAPVTQLICENESVADLQVTGNNVFFYTAPTAGQVVDPSTLITQSGTYYVAEKLICESNRIAVPFTVSMLANNAAAYYGDSIIKVITAASSYQWVDCATDSTLAGETNQTLTVPGNGSYYCMVGNADGCIVNTNCIYVVNLSVEENLANSVSVFPNPATSFVTLNATSEMAKFSLVSLSGEQIAAENINNTSYKLNLDNYTNGMYILSIYDTNNVLISKQKLIVNK